MPVWISAVMTSWDKDCDEDCGNDSDLKKTALKMFISSLLHHFRLNHLHGHLYGWLNVPPALLEQAFSHSFLYSSRAAHYSIVTIVVTQRAQLYNRDTHGDQCWLIWLINAALFMIYCIKSISSLPYSVNLSAFYIIHPQCANFGFLRRSTLPVD